MRKAFSMAAGAWGETRVPKAELISWSRFTIPSPIVTGSISANTWRMRGSDQSMCSCRRKSIRPSAAKASSSWTTVAIRTPIA